MATPQGSISESYNMFTNQVIGYSRNIGVTLEPVIYPQEFSSMPAVRFSAPPCAVCAVAAWLFLLQLCSVPQDSSWLLLSGSAEIAAIFIQSIASLDEIYGHTTARVILDNCTFMTYLLRTSPANCCLLLVQAETKGSGRLQRTQAD